MNVKFRKMNPQEYNSYYEYNISDYAKDLVKSSGITVEESLKQAKKEFADMLSEGMDTKDNSLMIIEDENTGKKVGIIWYLYELCDGVKQVFISDFVIYEEERRKGYAAAALAEMEHKAVEDDCTQSIIYVWKHNPPGVNLYTKCGYITFRESDDGMYMKKEL